jgi:hypothetical protein
MKIAEVLEVIEKEFKGKAYEDAVCQYLTQDGKKCLIGMFIPKNHAGSTYEGSVDYLLDKYPDLTSYMPTGDIKVLQELQMTHDGEFYADIEDFETLEEQKMYLMFEATRILGDSNEK